MRSKTLGELRPLREEDAEAVAVLYVQAFGKDRIIDAEEIRTWFRNEEMKPEWLRVLELEGLVVGYGDILVEDDEIALDVAAPGHWEPFLDWAESAGRRYNKPRVRAFFPSGHELTEIVERRGYGMSRSSFTMEAALDRAAPPVLPEGIEVRAFRPQDEDDVRTLLNEAFAQDPLFHEYSPSRFHEFHLKARGYDPSMWFLAWSEEELAGCALASAGHEGDTELGWIGELGVRAAYRRRGLGEALLRAAFHELAARGLTRVGLGVDTENVTGALRLYERVGMRPVSHWDNWILDLERHDDTLATTRQ